MNYLLHQLDESLQQILSLFDLNHEVSRKMIYKILTYIIDENNTIQEYQQKSDLLNLIYNLKGHFRENPCSKVKVFNVQKERKIGDLDENDLDIHKKCKKSIQELTEKLTKRDTLIQEQTSSYTKEIQHLTEQIYRLNHEKTNTDHIQIDRNLIQDQSIIDIVNKNFEKISFQYEHKIKHLNIIIEAQKRELVLTKQTLKDYKQKHEHHQQAEYLVRKLVQLEKDPYMLWKYFQDYHGNHFLLQVCKNQKNGYGINYKEIDQILSQAKIIERELQAYQKLIDSSLGQFMERLCNDQAKLKEIYTQKEQEFFTNIQMQNKLFNEIELKYQKIIEHLLNQNKQIILKTAISIWCQSSTKLQQEFIGNYVKGIIKLKQNNEIYEISTVLNQFVQIQSKIVWLQKMVTQYQQKEVKLLTQNQQLEGLVNAYKNKHTEKKTALENELDEQIRQKDNELLSLDQLDKGTQQDQFTQTDHYFEVPKLFVTPQKVPMQNEVIKQSFNNSKGFDSRQYGYAESSDMKNIFRSTLKNQMFDHSSLKTPRNRTSSGFNTSLESNIIELKPKILTEQKEYPYIKKKIYTQNETKIDSTKKTRKVDLLKQVELLSELQIQLKEFDQTPQMTQSQKQEKGFRASIKKKPDLSITFQQFHNNLNYQPMDLFSSTQRQQKLKSMLTKDSEYIIL